MKTVRPCLAVLTVLLSFNVTAMQADPAGRSLGGQDPAADFELATAGGAEHPAQYFRELGIEAQREGRQARAHEHFLRAARLADKLSQAAIAEQYWRGQGIPADRVLGYIWMDMAAERGTPTLIRLRESYWQALSADERGRVPALGPEVYAIYGDVAAQARVEREQRRERYNVVGSRVGWDNNVDVCVNFRPDIAGCVVAVPAEAVRGGR